MDPGSRVRAETSTPMRAPPEASASNRFRYCHKRNPPTLATRIARSVARSFMLSPLGWAPRIGTNDAFFVHSGHARRKPLQWSWTDVDTCSFFTNSNFITWHTGDDGDGSLRPAATTTCRLRGRPDPRRE